MSTNDPSLQPEKVVPQLLPIEKNNKTRVNIVLTNIVKMLTERKLLDISKQNDYIKRLIEEQTDDQTYKIDLDYPDQSRKLNKMMIIRLVNQKITSISKSPAINELMITYKEHPKIIVVTSISQKSRYLIQSDPLSYHNTEIFLEKELLTNLVDHVSQPKYVLLSDAETTAVLSAYHTKRREVPKILLGEPISLYYNVRPGQMFRIIRPSETSGQGVSYRLVVKGQIKES